MITMGVKFVADQMLGRLSKWLRLLGYDTLYFKSVADSDLIRIAKGQERFLLTRDTRLMKRRVIRDGLVKAMLVEGDLLDDQLRQVTRELGLQSGLLPPFCVECNLLLELVSKESTKDRVPPYVYRTQEHFTRCPGCGRFYWAGTHWERIKEKIFLLTTDSKESDAGRRADS